MSTLSNFYAVGTVTVANGSTAVVGTGTVWSSHIRENDILWVNGVDCRILTVLDNGRITLAHPWPGADGTAVSYEIRMPPPTADLTTGVRAVVESLVDGLVNALENLAWNENDILQYVGGELTNTSLTGLAAALASTLVFAHGSAAAPSINFNDTTGFSEQVSGHLVASVAGVQKVQFSSAGLGIRSTGAAFDLVLASTEVLTADHTLNVVLGNADRTLTVGGNVSFGGNVTTTGGAITLTATGATNVTFPTTGTLATLAGAETLTNKTFNASNNTLSNLTVAMFAANVVDTDTTLSTNSDSRIPSQKAVKTYFDNAITGLQWKTAVLCATTANITLSGEQTVDGVLTSASRVLVMNQTTGSQNGIYVTGASGWTRSTDMDAAAEFPSATVFVESGSTHASTQWTCTNTPGVTVGVTSIAFAQVAGAGTYSAGAGITLSSNQFSIANSAISYAMIQNATAARLLGNPTGGAAAPSEISLGSALAFSGTALQTVAMTGDVTTAANSFATTVATIGGTSVGGSTGSGNVVFATAPAIAGGTIAALTSFGIRSTGAAFDVKLRNTEVLTADRTITLITGNASRTLDLDGGNIVISGGNFTVSGNNITLTATGNTSVTMPLTGTLSTLAGSETLTNKTFNAASNTVSGIDTTMFAASVIDTDNTLTANSATRLATQSAVKGYVDALVQGLSWKRPVACVATSNVALTGEQTIDGVLTSGSRVLCVSQTTGSQNGIYVTAAGAWTRATDADTGTELVWATTVVEGGSVNAGVVYTCSTTSITLGTTTPNFVVAGVSTNTISAGTGLSLSGSVMSIGANAVTYALMQTVVANSFIGNPTGSTATAQAIGLGATLTFASTQLRTVAHTGDVTTPANSFVTTVAAIAGTTVSGTTGTGNVVFSAGPTFTGTMLAATATFSGAVTQAYASTPTALSSANIVARTGVVRNLVYQADANLAGGEGHGTLVQIINGRGGVFYGIRSDGTNKDGGVFTVWTGSDGGGYVERFSATSTGAGSFQHYTPVAITGGTASPGAALHILGGSIKVEVANAPSGACTATLVVAAGNLSAGAYTYKVTYVTMSGETTVGPASNSVTVDVSHAQVSLTAIPVSANGLVTARKIYRTAAGGSTYLLLTTINDNTTTTFTDNVADGSLGAATPSANTSGGSLIAATVALGGAAIGTNTFAVTGNANISGNLSGLTTLTMASGNINIQGGDALHFGARTYVDSTADGNIRFQNNGLTTSSFLSFPASGTIQFGAADAASPVAQTIGFQNVATGTADTAGATATIRNSAGTGTGLGGNIVFLYAPHGSTGSAKNAWATALTINGDTAAATFVGNVTAPIVGPANGGQLRFWGTGTCMQNPSDGIITFLDNNGTAFNRLQLGGTTSSFPALKRSGTTLAVRLADDSGDADLSARAITATGRFQYGQGAAAAAFGTAGVGIVGGAFTQTDSTTAAGTVATVYGSVHGAVTFATATNAVTITNAYGHYFVDPVAGSHVTTTSKYALGADSAKINGALNVTGTITTAGSLTFSGAMSLSGNAISPSGAQLNIQYGSAAAGDVVLGIGGANAFTYEMALCESDSGGANNARVSLQIQKVASTGRSISTAGTINASGADYAEYERKAQNCGDVAKGQIIGFDEDGKVTDKWAEAISFGIKSTSPSYVGGDDWGSHEALGIERVAPPIREEGESDEDFDARVAERKEHMDELRAAVDAARVSVDRIAYSGKVPVNVKNAEPGDYIIAVQAGKFIGGLVVKEPSFQQFLKCVGRVRRIQEDGRAVVAVVIH